MAEKEKLKAAVFIEGSNVYFAQKKMGKWLDWVKVKKYLDENFRVTEIRYYAGVRSGDLKVQSFLKKLCTIGFVTITKPVKIIIDETGGRVEKANFDIEITTDILQIFEQVDVIILFSGDSDFDYLVKFLRQHKKKVFVYSSRKTLSWELRLSADRHIFFEDLLDLTKGEGFVKL